MEDLQQKPDTETLMLALAWEMQQLRLTIGTLTETIATLTEELRN